MITIIHQHEIDVYLVDSATYNYTFTVQASTNSPGAELTYTWEYYDAANVGDFVNVTEYVTYYNDGFGVAEDNYFTIIGTTQAKVADNALGLRCIVSDNGGSAPVTTEPAVFKLVKPWLEGITDPVMPKDGGAVYPVTDDIYIKGGTHVYSTSAALCDARANRQRVKIGQIGILAEPGKLPKAYRFVTENTDTLFANTFANWQIGVDWIEAPLMFADVDNETTFLTPDNKILAIAGGGEVIPPDEKTIVIQDNKLSAVPYDQDLNTFNSVKFHDVTTNVVIENTMAIQTYAYATSSTVGRNSLSAINNSEATQGSIGGTTFAFNSVDYNYSVTGFADTTFPTLTLVRGRLYSFNLTNVSNSHPFALRLTNGGSTTPVPGTTNNDVNNGAYNVTITYQVPLDAPSVIYYQCTSFYQMVGTINIVNPGPYNVLEVTANSKKYIPLDLTRANTFLLTLSDASNSIGTYDGFVLINNAPLTSSFDVSLDANTTYQTFIEPDSIKGKIYTITLFVKHLNVMSILPLNLYKGAVHTGTNRIADVFSVTQIPVKWSAGLAPALYETPASGAYTLGSEDVIMYTTYDAGATWYGFIGGTDLR